MFNKLDALEDPTEFALIARDRFPAAIFTSTMHTDGLQPLKAELRGRAEAMRPAVRILLDPSDGKQLGFLHREGDVLQQEMAGERLAVVVRLEPWRAEQLRREGLDVQGAAGIGNGDTSRRED